MKSYRSGLLVAASLLLMTSAVVFAQAPMKDVLKETAKEGAMEMLGVKKPVQGQAEMMDGAKMMMNGKKSLKSDLVKNAKVKEGAALEGEVMMSDGYEMMVDGDKLLQAQKIPDGKKKMMDGSKMMMDAKKKMMDDLTRKGMMKADQPSEGETMMKDGERMMKNGEMMMLK